MEVSGSALFRGKKDGLDCGQGRERPAMTGSVAVIRPAQPLASSELFARADRLWQYADEIYSATQYPFVSFRVLKTAPNFGAIWEHIAEAARAEVEAAYAPRLKQLEDEIARLEAETVALGGTLPPVAVPSQRQIAPPEVIQLQPQRQKSADIDPSEIPWLRDWFDSMVARARIDSALFHVFDDEVQEPPTYWPEAIRRPVAQLTQLELVNAADRIIRGLLRVPRGESAESYMARFTRRVLRLHGDRWDAVAVAIAEGRWQQANNPVAYINRVAQREHLRAEGWLDPSRSTDVYAQQVPASLDEYVTVASEPLETLISDRSDPLAEAEFWIDFEDAVRRSALTPGAELALYARREGISRREAPDAFGLPASRVESGWKALQRALPTLRANLSA